MSPSCTQLSGDIATLYDWLISSGVSNLDDIDVGVQKIDFIASPPHTVTIPETRGNGCPESGEVLAKTIEGLGEEEKSAFASSSFTSDSFPRSDFIAGHTSFRPGWFLSEHLQGASVDVVLMQKIAARLNEIKNALTSSGLTPETMEYNTALAKALSDYMLASDGLGINRASGHAPSETSVVEMLTQTQVGDCSELSMMFMELCRLAGLDAHLVFVTIDNTGRRVDHMCVALRLNPSDPDEITLADPTWASPFLATPHKEWVELSDLDAATNFKMSRGVLPPGEYHEPLYNGFYARMSDRLFNFKLGEYMTALSYDPYLSLIYFNLSDLYEIRGDEATAEEFFEKGMALYPGYTAAE